MGEVQTFGERPLRNETDGLMCTAVSALKENVMSLVLPSIRSVPVLIHLLLLKFIAQRSHTGIRGRHAHANA